MLKKIGISILIAFIFVFPIQQQYMQTANAAIASKAATQAAKKIAKEAIKDAAINTAANYAVNEAMKIANDAEMKAKPGYMLICMDYKYDKSKKCEKPMQIKQNLTDADKSAIGGQAEIEIDKAINGGKGFSKWQKFLDWFLPVWLVSFGATALTYAMDGEVRDLFNEIGYNALVALGILAPVTKSGSGMSSIVGEDGSIKEKPAMTTKPPTVEYTYEMTSTLRGPSFVWNGLALPIQDTVIAHQFHNQSPITNTTFYSRVYADFNNTQYLDGQVSTVIGLAFAWKTIHSKNVTTVKIDGKEVPWDDATMNGKTGKHLYIKKTLFPHTDKINAILHRLPYEKDGNLYTDVLVYTSDGHTMELSASLIRPASYENIPSTFSQTDISPETSSGTGTRYAKITIWTNVESDVPISLYEPNYADLNIDMMESSAYQKNGRVALLPPDAYTYKEEATGETVRRMPNPDGSGVVFQKPDGTPVPEDNVVIKDEPTITPAPKPDPNAPPTSAPAPAPTYTPAPTPENPAPPSVPLTPGPTDTGEPPLEPLPEGAKCDAKLQFPIFSPLKETFSTSFPFSIPWDIGRAIEAAFGDIGTEKPEYEIKIDVAGTNETFKITTPAFFDKWKPFTDSFLVFTFDVLIMFGIFRFVKGAGS